MYIFTRKGQATRTRVRLIAEPPNLVVEVVNVPRSILHTYTLQYSPVYLFKHLNIPGSQLLIYYSYAMYQFSDTMNDQMPKLKATQG